MTKEENIATLNEHLDHWKRLLSEKICDQDEGEKTIDALHNAIKVLEQEPCEELDFVQPHKKVSVNLEVCKMREATQEEREGVEMYIDSIADIVPSKWMAEDTCEDCISRQAVLAAMRKNHLFGGRDIDGDYIEGDYRECLYDEIISLPSITPAEKVGHWIPYIPDYDTEIEYYVCSECKNRCMGKTRYCFDCGCKMQEVES